MSMTEEAQPGRRPGAPRGFRRLLSDEEAEDYRHLRWRHHYTESEALVAVGRGDLVGQ